MNTSAHCQSVPHCTLEDKHVGSLFQQEKPFCLLTQDVVRMWNSYRLLAFDLVWSMTRYFKRAVQWNYIIVSFINYYLNI